MDETLGTGLLFAAEFKRNPQNFVLVASNLYGAQRLYEFLLNFLPEEDVIFFPADELLRAETLVSSKELLSQRLYAMNEALQKRKKILVCHPGSLLRYLPHPERFEEECIRVKLGTEMDLSALKKKLSALGYEKVERIEAPLQFASRGDILDVYSANESDPVRIEFFGDEVDAIKRFDIQNQRSTTTLKETLILPATDIFLSESEFESFSLRAQKQIALDRLELGDQLGDDLEEAVTVDLDKYGAHDYKSYLYRYYGYALGEAYSIVSYLDAPLVFIGNKTQFEASLNMNQMEADDFLNELHFKGKALSHLHHYMGIADGLAYAKKTIYGLPYAKTGNEHLFTVHRSVANTGGFSGIPTLIESYLGQYEKTVLMVSDEHKKEAITALLKENDIAYETVEGFELPEGKLGICSQYLNEGFEIPSLHVAYLSENDVYGRKLVASRFTSRFKNGTVLRSFEDLKPGDYVVHEYNGIGQFAGVKTIVIEGKHRDFLHILYANNQALYVPLEQFRLVRKYAGREGAVPKLSSLYGTDWEKKKKQIQSRVNDLADRLIALYGSRAKGNGFAFPPDDEIQRRFEDEFPYELTSDQAEAVRQIKADMEKPDIMDRLLCGDVGFGKTEVAFRAAFKAIGANKQVALLCPTTLLARQHYELARERFATFGVRVGLLSRLVANKDQKDTIKRLKNGEIDLIIGTHRLLSKEVEYKDLGLLIVDEEQRFGVEQKEKIKELKSSVDVLTLSATPIPRTLQMSLVGIRALSEINTPPSFRSPIQTYVTPYSREVVAELIQRELGRHGQVFYLHNDISTIYATASRIAKMAPGASIGVAHGRMEKTEIEDVMTRFYDGEINVLVCTSIVENGIDVPNANMIIVENADRFGLSQLHQIKGRVGRGNRIAYAYLLYREDKEMNQDAQKRLKAISEFTELGSGYKIAQRDLMIRGAGDILGPEQAGFIDSVGLDLYLKLLNEAIVGKTTGVVAAPPEARKMFDLDAYIPSDYANDGDKMNLYQELDECKTEEDIGAFEKKVRDIYGRVPKEVATLVMKKRVDVLLENEEFATVEEANDHVNLVMDTCFSRINGIGNILFDALSSYLLLLRVSFVNRQLKIILSKEDDWLKNLYEIVVLTHQVYLKSKGNISQS